MGESIYGGAKRGKEKTLKTTSPRRKLFMNGEAIETGDGKGEQPGKRS